SRGLNRYGHSEPLCRLQSVGIDALQARAGNTKDDHAMAAAGVAGRISVRVAGSLGECRHGAGECRAAHLEWPSNYLQGRCDGPDAVDTQDLCRSAAPIRLL